MNPEESTSPPAPDPAREHGQEELGEPTREEAQGLPREKDPCSLRIEELSAILEALLFVSENPLTLEKLQGILEGCDRSRIQEALKLLRDRYALAGGALEIVEVASGFHVRTKPEFAPWLRRLKQQRPPRLSRSSLETLAIIAYNQPITRAEIEHIRGVDSMGVLGSLVEKQLVRIIGRKDVPGRPLIYGTTTEFLEVFGLKNLKSLPTLKEIEEMLGPAAPDRADRPEQEGGEDTSQAVVGAGRDGLSGTQGGEAGHGGEGRPRCGEEARSGPSQTSGDDTEQEVEEVSTEEIDEILREARARSRSVRKECGLSDGGGQEPAPDKEA